MPAVLAASVETCVLLVLEQWLWSSLVCCYFADKTAAIGRVGPAIRQAAWRVGPPSVRDVRANRENGWDRIERGPSTGALSGFFVAKDSTLSLSVACYTLIA